jgi:hypothetical protein
MSVYVRAMYRPQAEFEPISHANVMELVLAREMAYIFPLLIVAQAY